MKSIKELIDKYDSNWFYCSCKDRYGNEIINLLREFVDDLKDCEKKRRRR